MRINKITKLVSKLGIGVVVSVVNIISLQEAAFSNTYRITFKEGPLDIKCPSLHTLPTLPIIYTNSESLNLELVKAKTCSLTPNINVEELEDSLGTPVLTYDVFNKKGVLLDVLPFSNNS